MRLTVERYEDSMRDEWDELARGARARHFLFERDYLEYHADRFTDASLVVRRGAGLVALLPATLHGEEMVAHGGLTFGSLLSDERLTTADTVDAFGAIVGHARDAGVARLVLKPVPHIYHLAPAEEELYALSVHGARLERRDVSAAVPACSRPAYSTERRRAVRRGRGHDLVLGPSDAIEEFMALLGEVLLARHGVEPVHTAAELRLLATRFPAAITLYTATAAHGRVVAGVVVYETPAVAHAQYIAASQEGRELYAQDALFAHLLEDVYRTKPWFDFGISNERDGSLNGGLMRNKEGFGARAVVHDRYVLEIG